MGNCKVKCVNCTCQPLKILVCGSRYWTSKTSIRAQLRQQPPNSILVHGAAQGADTLAAEVAQELGWEIRAYPADWKTHGRAAGPIRNQLMLDQENPDLVIAFHEDPNLGKGTKHMVGIARQAGVKVITVIKTEVV